MSCSGLHFGCSWQLFSTFTCSQHQMANRHSQKVGGEHSDAFREADNSLKTKKQNQNTKLQINYDDLLKQKKEKSTCLELIKLNLVIIKCAHSCIITLFTGISLNTQLVSNSFSQGFFAFCLFSSSITRPGRPSLAPCIVLITSLQAAGAVGSSEVPPRPQGAVGADVSEPHEEAAGAFAGGSQTPHCG